MHMCMCMCMCIHVHVHVHVHVMYVCHMHMSCMSHVCLSVCTRRFYLVAEVKTGSTDRLFSGQSAEVRPATDRLSSVVLFVGLHSFSSLSSSNFFLSKLRPSGRLKAALSSIGGTDARLRTGLFWQEATYTVVLRHY